MKAVIKVSEYQDNYGWHNIPHFFGLFESEKEVQKAIRKDVKNLTADWEIESVPKVSIKNFYREDDMVRGFRFSDYEDSDDSEDVEEMFMYADNVWTYIIEDYDNETR